MRLRGKFSFSFKPKSGSGVGRLKRAALIKFAGNEFCVKRRKSRKLCKLMQLIGHCCLVWLWFELDLNFRV